MLDVEKIKKDLERDEGKINHAYQDSEGYWTIGVGHLIDKRKQGSIPNFIIEALLEYDIDEKSKELDKIIPFWRNLDALRQRVLLNMAFNLGVGNLMGFKRFLQALRDSDYTLASIEMMDSKWARQVGKRAERLSKMMRTGEDV